MVVYLPLAFVKDWLCNLLRKRSSKSGKNVGNKDLPSSEIVSPRKGNGVQKHFELEILKDSELDVSAFSEGKPLIARHNDKHVLKAEKELTSWEIASYGFFIAPIWFLTEVSYFKDIFVYAMVLDLYSLCPI